MVSLEPVQVTLGLRKEYTLDEMSAHTFTPWANFVYIPTGMLLGGGKKPENPEKAYTYRRIKCTETPYRR